MGEKEKKIILEIEGKSKTLLALSHTTHGIKRSLRNLIKEIGLFKAGMGTSMAQNISKKSFFVQVGGGRHYLEEFLNIDISPPADIIWDVREGMPLQSNSAHFIFSEHFLEHIDYPVSAKKFIKECYRVLSKKGQVVVGVPESHLAVAAYYRNDKKMINEFVRRWYKKRNCLNHLNTTIDFLNYHFRDQDDDKKYNPHLWAYDYEKLYSLFKNTGFSKIKRWKFDKTIANPKRKWGSLYVAASK